MAAGWLLAAMALAAPPPERSLLVLAAGGVEVGIAPRLAGRVVLLRRAGGPNVLLSDPAGWAPGAAVPPLAPDAPWTAFNGHVVWTGPQREWWTHQDLAPAKRAGRDDWPPDPWAEFAPYTVERRSSAAAVLAGPDSPVTGLALRKEVRVEPDGTVRVRVTARNVRSTPVSWDLWSNTRVPATDRVFVPLDDQSQIRFEHWSASPWNEADVPSSVAGGWFTFLGDEPLPAGAVARVAKAFIRPARGVIAAFGGGTLFVKRFGVTPPDRIHPSQSPVEIFLNVNRDPKASLLELEAHGVYTELSPGAETAFEEAWTLTPSAGASDPAACRAVLARVAP